ncbi:peptide deformylase-like [Striga asiatica]|uniref:Peptide deformylase-like n=1 Tax=Striga asiatica TaxID=4170 RepID=A0A5A7Q027_STRAF|nr:peptide deformylase-like [Striga asiatica]
MVLPIPHVWLLIPHFTPSPINGSSTGHTMLLRLGLWAGPYPRSHRKQPYLRPTAYSRRMGRRRRHHRGMEGTNWIVVLFHPLPFHSFACDTLWHLLTRYTLVIPGVPSEVEKTKPCRKTFQTIR